VRSGGAPAHRLQTERSELQKLTILNILKAQIPAPNGSFELRPKTSLLNL
jgi:hypothetical protein